MVFLLIFQLILWLMVYFSSLQNQLVRLCQLCNQYNLGEHSLWKIVVIIAVFTWITWIHHYYFCWLDLQYILNLKIFLLLTYSSKCYILHSIIEVPSSPVLLDEQIPTLNPSQFMEVTRIILIVTLIWDLTSISWINDRYLTISLFSPYFSSSYS